MTLCPDYPVTSYSLVLEDSDGNQTVYVPEDSQTDDLVNIVVEDLREDTIYHFYILAENQFGNSSGFVPIRIGELQNIGLVVIQCPIW